jgi:CHAD domain-containing protein
VTVGGKEQLSAHELVKSAVEGLVARTRAAADRMLDARDDAEAVHDFRVGLRRLRTVLGASGRLYGKKRVKSLIGELKKFGDATNSLRDAEVLSETIDATAIDGDVKEQVHAWLERRALGEGQLRDAAIELLAGPQLDSALSSLLGQMDRGPKKDQTAPVFAEKRFDAARRGVRELLPVERADSDRLHRLRIRFKRLRYTCEMLGQLMTRFDAEVAPEQRPSPAADYPAIAKMAARMQKDLGLLHDADVALDTIGDDDSLDDRLREHISHALLGLRGRLVDRAVDRLEALPHELVGQPTTPSVP